MYTQESLKALGFEMVMDEATKIPDFVNKVKDNVHLVVSPLFKEVFIWIIDEDADDKDMDGTKIIIDSDKLEEAISFCKLIAGVDNGI